MSRGEVTSIPRRTLIGALLCRLGRHKWIPAGVASVVIPTGSALLIKRQRREYRCARRDCPVRRAQTYDRDKARAS